MLARCIPDYFELQDFVRWLETVAKDIDDLIGTVDAKSLRTQAIRWYDECKACGCVPPVASGIPLNEIWKLRN